MAPRTTTLTENVRLSEQQPSDKLGLNRPRRRKRSGSAGSLYPDSSCTADGSLSKSDAVTSPEIHGPVVDGSWLEFLVPVFAAGLVFITVISIPHAESTSILGNVWWYGWITAISTGLGAVPFTYWKSLDKFWLGISNGLASGMMIAASGCLLMEGIYCDGQECWTRTALGLGLGLAFIIGTKQILDQHEDLKLGALDGLDARKVFLIMGVMTLHSFSEGVGIGVSFSGENGEGRGLLISTTLAIHNVPEGLAISLVLVPRGVSFLRASLWSIISSLPQPIMAVIAYLFIEEFIPLLPVGLGFAAGAMSYVAVFELLVESYEDTRSVKATGLSVLVSMCFMVVMHSFISI